LLSLGGAYSQDEIYSHEDIITIVNYANARGIRVLPEFDMPAHATSWGYGYPWLIMNCTVFKPQCVPPPFAPENYGDGCADDPFDPTNPATYTLLKGFLTEMSTLFPDSYLHLGGDELQYRIQCWNITRINDWMKSHGIANYYDLQNYFVGQTHQIIAPIPRQLINWQELFNEGMTLVPNQIIQVWKDHATLDSVVKAGYRATLSFGWYLDNLDQDWQNMYSNEPDDGTLTPSQLALVLGGEACMWGERVDGTNIVPRVWPRTAAVAERLWSAKSVNNVNEAAIRLHDMRCRLKARGIPSEPLGPGWCY